MHTFIVFTTSWLAEHVCLIDAYILSVVIADTWTHSSWWCCSWYEDDVLALVLTTNYYMSLLVGWCFGQSQQYAGSPSWRDCGWGLYYVLHWYCLMYGFPLCVLPRGGIVGRGGIVDEECTMSYTGIVSCLDFCYVLGLARHCNLHQQKTCLHWWGTVLVIANDITKQYRRSVFLSYISFI
jgi:hypothetical protein